MTAAAPGKGRQWFQFAGIVLVGLATPAVLLVFIGILVDRLSSAASGPAQLEPLTPPEEPPAVVPVSPPAPPRVPSAPIAPALAPPDPDPDIQSDEEAEAEAHRPHPPEGVGRDDDLKESGLPPALFMEVTGVESRGQRLFASVRGKASEAQMAQLQEAWSGEYEKAQLAVGYYRLKRLDERAAQEVIQGAERAFAARASKILGLSLDEVAALQTPPEKLSP